jgi:hypothetical protein
MDSLSGIGYPRFCQKFFVNSSAQTSHLATLPTQAKLSLQQNKIEEAKGLMMKVELLEERDRYSKHHINSIGTIRNPEP